MLVIKKIFLNDKFILILILLNSLVLFIQGYIEDPFYNILINVFDHFITLLFIVEMVIKVDVYGFRTYLKSNWNKLDFVLIILSVPSFITFVLGVDLLDFSFLLVFRVLRVFKTFRFFKFIPEIGNLLNGIRRAFKASIFIFLGFTVYIFVIGILSYYLFHSSDTESFSNPLISLYSTFKLFTLEGWSDISESLVSYYPRAYSILIYFYFIFVVLTGGVFGLSIVNSIFVDAMVSDNNDELEKKIDNLNRLVAELITKTQNNETRKNP
ncbi:ion transporter [Saccharicrinis sp. FJH62]|uniref:ion transporter n=1 Tax=Saccharicrinis sp. FJH62 TaxID=3344657 RepID=UPI0035D4F1C0